MNRRDDSDPGHEEVLSLLPWYANRTLDPETASSVARHVDRCDECRSEIRFLVSIDETVRNDADERYRAQADAGTALASVLDRIDAENGPANEREESWPARLKGALERLLPNPAAAPGFRWGATAVAALLVAVLALQVYRGGPSDDYSVLSSPDGAEASTRLVVEVAPTADPEQARFVIEGVLDLDGRQDRADIRAGADGVYVVELAGEIGVDDLNELLRALESEARIERAELLP